MFYFLMAFLIKECPKEKLKYYLLIKCPSMREMLKGFGHMGKVNLEIQKIIM